MKTIVLIFSVLSSGLTFSQERSCKELYDKFCPNGKYSKNCSNLEINNNYLNPPDNILDDLKDRSSEILKLANKYQINPRIIVSSILSANTINPLDIGERAQTWLYQFSEKPKTALPSHYGIGRISEENFTNIDILVSKMNHREQETKEQIKNRIYNENEDLEYTAALIKQKILAYEKEDFHIGDDIKIVTSTYGIAKVTGIPAKHKRNGTKPKINLWGAVSICLESYVDDVLGSIEKDKNPTHMKNYENGKTYNGPTETKDNKETNNYGSGATEQ